MRPSVAGPTALYRIFAAEDVLLYIGVSNNFGRRWNEHARKQAWWNERRRMTVDWYDSRDEALDAEALAVFDEQPPHNVMHRKQAQRLKKLQLRPSAAAHAAELIEAGRIVTLIGTPIDLAHLTQLTRRMAGEELTAALNAYARSDDREGSGYIPTEDEMRFYAATPWPPERPAGTLSIARGDFVGYYDEC